MEETHHESRRVKKAKDPVCNMDVAVENTSIVTEYQARNYYFCTELCKVLFEKNPG